MAGGSSGALGCFRDHPVDRVLDHQRNRRRELSEEHTSSAEAAGSSGKETKGTGPPAHLHVHVELFCRNQGEKEKEEREQWLFRKY